MPTIKISIDAGTLSRLTALAPRGDRNRSLLVRRALHAYLDRLERDQADRAAFAKHRDEMRRDAARLVRRQPKP